MALWRRPPRAGAEGASSGGKRPDQSLRQKDRDVHDLIQGGGPLRMERNVDLDGESAPSAGLSVRFLSAR